MHDFRPRKIYTKVEDPTTLMLQKKVPKPLGSRALFRPRPNILLRGGSMQQLEPILEEEDSQAAHLKQINLPTRSIQNGQLSSKQSTATKLSDPDNGIYFLDNETRLYNP